MGSCCQGKEQYDEKDVKRRKSLQKLFKTKTLPGIFVAAKDYSPQKDYIIQKKLGEGAYGKVMQAQHRQIKEKIVAIKEMELNNQNRDKLMEEIQVLLVMDHPHVMRILEYYFFNDSLYIVCEFLSGGVLLDRIMKLKQFSEKIAAEIMLQLLQGLNYLHMRGITHRDLKVDNLVYEDETYSAIKIIDFGETIISEGNEKIDTKGGTFLYMAPEVLLGDLYDQKCDIWSCGIIMYVLLTGQFPYGTNNYERDFKRITTGDKYYKKNPRYRPLSSLGKDLMERMLEKDPEKRISAKDALKHQWFQQVEKIEIEEDQANDILDSLKQFHTQSKIQKIFYAYVSGYMLEKDEEKKLHEFFHNIDKDDDGELSKEEIKQGYQKYKGKFLTENEIDEIFDEVDDDKSGTISYQEFLMGSFNKSKKEASKKLQKAFDMMDKDGDGYITKSELKDLFGNNYNQNMIIKNIISEVDKDDCGRISKEDFDLMMKESYKKEENDEG